MMAQEDYRYSVYKTEDGLPSCLVNNIFQDSRDFLWLCTDAGLCRYDGRRFVNYSLADGLFGASVFSVKEDKHGNLWVVTAKGLSKFDGREFTEIDFKLPDILDLLVDSDKVWIATKKGLYIYDIPTAVNQKQKALDDAKITCLLKRKDGSILIGTNRGICAYKTGFFDFWRPAEPQYLFGMTEDISGVVWFYTLQGSWDKSGACVKM